MSGLAMLEWTTMSFRVDWVQLCGQSINQAYVLGPQAKLWIRELCELPRLAILCVVSYINDRRMKIIHPRTLETLHLKLSQIQHSGLFIWLILVHQIRSDQSLSRVRLFATPWITARQASLSITNSRSSPRLTSIESVMPSSHLILCRPLLLLPPIPLIIRVFSNESTLCMRWPKYWSFSFSIIPSKEHPGLISLSFPIKICNHKYNNFHWITQILKWISVPESSFVIFQIYEWKQSYDCALSLWSLAVANLLTY